MDNLTYEKCKELKDAGFPMKLATPTSESIWGGTGTGGIVYERPILEELIDWCGDRFLSLKKKSVVEDLWIAFGGFPEKGISLVEEMNIKVEGKTPKEAVANLGLKIHKKDEKNS